MVDGGCIWRRVSSDTVIPPQFRSLERPTVAWKYVEDGGEKRQLHTPQQRTSRKGATGKRRGGGGGGGSEATVYEEIHQVMASRAARFHRDYFKMTTTFVSVWYELLPEV